MPRLGQMQARPGQMVRATSRVSATTQVVRANGSDGNASTLYQHARNRQRSEEHRYSTKSGFSYRFSQSSDGARLVAERFVVSSRPETTWFPAPTEIEPVHKSFAGPLIPCPTVLYGIIVGQIVSFVNSNPPPEANALRANYGGEAVAGRPWSFSSGHPESSMRQRRGRYASFLRQVAAHGGPGPPVR